MPIDDAARERLERFRKERQRQNARILEAGHLGLKRFFNLDEATYRDGALDARTKDLLGAFNVALIVGGSIVIPHLRHAVDSMDALLAEAGAGPSE